MLAGTALYIRLLVYVGLSLFIISGLYVYMVVCVVYAYNLTPLRFDHIQQTQLSRCTYFMLKLKFIEAKFESERRVYMQSIRMQH